MSLWPWICLGLQEKARAVDTQGVVGIRTYGCDGGSEAGCDAGRGAQTGSDGNRYEVFVTRTAWGIASCPIKLVSARYARGTLSVWILSRGAGVSKVLCKYIQVSVPKWH